MLQDEVVLLDTRNRELHSENDRLKSALSGEATERELADEAAFQKLVVDLMVFAPTTVEPERTKIIGNARRAWHTALRWEREHKGN